jgi:hypothetical protein
MSLLPQKPPVTLIKTKKKLQTAYISGKGDRIPSAQWRFLAGHYNDESRKNVE